MAEETQEAQPQPAAQPKVKPAAAPAEPSGAPRRPTGVTVVSILGIIISLLTIVGGAGLLGLGGLAASAGVEVGMSAALMAGLSGMAMILGAAFLVIGIIELVAYVMLLKMKRVGWILVVLFGIITIVMGLVTNPMGNIISIVITVIIIAYLFTKRQLFV